MNCKGIAGILLALLALSTEVQATTIGIDTRRTYLRTGSDPGALAAVPLELAGLGLTAGDTVTLKRLGGFDCGPPCIDDRGGMVAVFSSSNTLLASNLLRRVPGAIEAGVDFVTAPTNIGALATDIPEDFLVLGTGVTVTVPAGAVYLFVVAYDIFYGDNTDPNGDFAVDIKKESPPTANAGADQSIHAGQVVTLDGSGSFDDDTATQDLVYAWTLSSMPEGSSATLTDADTASPWFVADMAGEYAVSLVVTDELGLSSIPDTVVVSSQNAAPVADAGADGGTFVGQAVSLDGAASHDPDGDALTFAWALAAPAGSTAALADGSTAFPTFVPDVPGSYTATLTVNDAFGGVGTDTVALAVITAEDHAQDLVLCALNQVGALPPWQVTTKGNQKAFQNFLNQAIAALQAGDLEEGRLKLTHAIERTDGCGLRSAPDGNGAGRDWITDCGAQAAVYDCLAAALAALQP
jgi:hypothetical protein